MAEHRVTGWTDWDDESYPKYAGEYVGDIVAAELRKMSYKFTGDYHQNGNYGVPIIDEKYRLLFSQRGWGRIVSMAYPDEIDDSEGYGYLAWAWMTPNGERQATPDPDDYKGGYQDERA